MLDQDFISRIDQQSHREVIRERRSHRRDDAVFRNAVLHGQRVLQRCIVVSGRTPQIDSRPAGAGRHHWSRAYSAAFAGGGIARGRVVGSTDRFGGDVRDTPVSPKDILATTYHLLGIDPHTTVPDVQGRPIPIAGDGQVRTELFG